MLLTERNEIKINYLVSSKILHLDDPEYPVNTMYMSPELFSYEYGYYPNTDIWYEMFYFILFY